MLDGCELLLMEVFAEYADVLATEDVPGRLKARLAALAGHADAQGLIGVAAFDGLENMQRELRGELMDTKKFATFYKFVFFICRARGQKNLSVASALRAWKLCLQGRFRLLDQWCSFLEAHHRFAISEDTWRQVLDFSRSVHEDLSDYDPEGAWPLLIDEFVESMYRKSSLPACNPVVGSYAPCPPLVPAMVSTINTGIVERSKQSSLQGMVATAGSKRRWKDQRERSVQAQSVNVIVQRMAELSPSHRKKRTKIEHSQLLLTGQAKSSLPGRDPIPSEEAAPVRQIEERGAVEESELESPLDVYRFGSSEDASPVEVQGVEDLMEADDEVGEGPGTCQADDGARPSWQSMLNANNSAGPFYRYVHPKVQVDFREYPFR